MLSRPPSYLWSDMRSLTLACAIGSMALAASARTHEMARGVSAQIAKVEQGNQMVARQNDASSAEENISARATDQHQQTAAPGMAAQAELAAQGEHSVARETDVSSSARRKEFVARALGDTEDVWSAVFKAMGNPPYPMPTVVLFSFGTSSACGFVKSTVGPFYCPADRQIYIDPDFLSDLSRRSTALGDFAQAYLLAREVAHHVQSTLGTTPQFENSLSQADEARPVQLRVRRELQADCFAGVWAFYVHKLNRLAPEDLENGVPAAQTFGDVSTHGTPAQRMRWFNLGLAAGDPRKCDTFSVLQP